MSFCCRSRSASPETCVASKRSTDACQKEWPRSNRPLENAPVCVISGDAGFLEPTNPGWEEPHTSR
jgi:hypothetical protein